MTLILTVMQAWTDIAWSWLQVIPQMMKMMTLILVRGGKVKFQKAKLLVSDDHIMNISNVQHY